MNFNFQENLKAAVTSAESAMRSSPSTNSFGTRKASEPLRESGLSSASLPRTSKPLTLTQRIVLFSLSAGMVVCAFAAGLVFAYAYMLVRRNIQ